MNLSLSFSLLIGFLQARRAELLSFVAVTVNMGLLFGWWAWTADQVAGANLFAVALLGLLVGQTQSTLNKAVVQMADMEEKTPG